MGFGTMVTLPPAGCVDLTCSDDSSDESCLRPGRRILSCAGLLMQASVLRITIDIPTPELAYSYIHFYPSQATNATYY